MIRLSGEKTNAVSQDCGKQVSRGKEKSSGEGKDLFSAAPDDQTRFPRLRRQCSRRHFLILRAIWERI